MPRLFFGNFDFEESLVRPIGQPRPARVERILAELAATWVAIVQDGDLIWCPQQVDESFIDELTQAGWPPFHIVCRPEQIPQGCEFVPWGWTAEAVEFGMSAGTFCTAPPLEVVRQVNSRQFSLDLETSLGIRLEGHVAASNEHELDDAVRRCISGGGQAVVKAEFSQAGRDRFVVAPDDSSARDRLRSWADRQWRNGQRLYVEPLLDAIAEAGLQFDISPAGDVSLLGIAEMVPSPSGGYAGSILRGIPDDHARWNAAVTVGMEAARAVAVEGYFGPLGIDVMQYRAADGSIAVRPVQEINARWTMGRLSLGLQRFVPQGSEARWLHGTALDTLLSCTHTAEVRRIVFTSPQSVDQLPVSHRTALVW